MAITIEDFPNYVVLADAFAHAGIEDNDHAKLLTVLKELEATGYGIWHSHDLDGG